MKLPEICRSKKAQATAAIILVVVLEDLGLVSPGAAQKIELALLGYVGAQSISDIGKEKAKIEAGKGT